MKDFNLEKALAGAPVTTRLGKSVTELHLFKTAVSTEFPLTGVVEGSIKNYKLNGKWAAAGDSVSDLFMAPQKKQEWLNIYAPMRAGEQYRGVGPYPSEVVAKNTQYIDCIATVLIREWEE